MSNERLAFRELQELIEAQKNSLFEEIAKRYIPIYTGSLGDYFVQLMKESAEPSFEQINVETLNALLRLTIKSAWKGVLHQYSEDGLDSIEEQVEELQGQLYDYVVTVITRLHEFALTSLPNTN